MNPFIVNTPELKKLLNRNGAEVVRYTNRFIPLQKIVLLEAIKGISDDHEFEVILMGQSGKTVALNINSLPKNFRVRLNRKIREFEKKFEIRKQKPPKSDRPRK